MILRLDLNIDMSVPDVVLNIEHTLYRLDLNVQLQSAIDMVR